MKRYVANRLYFENSPQTEHLMNGVAKVVLASDFDRVNAELEELRAQHEIAVREWHANDKIATYFGKILGAFDMAGDRVVERCIERFKNAESELARIKDALAWVEENRLHIRPFLGADGGWIAEQPDCTEATYGQGRDPLSAITALRDKTK